MSVLYVETGLGDDGPELSKTCGSRFLMRLLGFPGPVVRIASVQPAFDLDCHKLMGFTADLLVNPYVWVTRH